MDSRRNFKDEAVVSASESKFGDPPGLRHGDLALYSLTTWSITNSAALAVMAWPRSPMILGHASLTAQSILLPLSLLSMTMGFLWACGAVLDQPRGMRSWGTLALAIAVLGQFVYTLIPVRLY
jgi:hypothetical protein